MTAKKPEEAAVRYIVVGQPTGKDGKVLEAGAEVTAADLKGNPDYLIDAGVIRPAVAKKKG